MSTAISTALVVPTLRATGWRPLAAVATTLVVVGVLAAEAGAWPVDLLGLVAAALAAATVAGLRDPAAQLLAALPTSAAARRTHRLVLLVPAGAAVWCAWLGAGHRWTPALEWPVAGLLALMTLAVAVVVWTPERWALAAGVGAPLAWAVCARVGGLDWDRHAGIVIVAALAATWLGRNR